MKKPKKTPMTAKPMKGGKMGGKKAPPFMKGGGGKKRKADENTPV